MDIVMTGSAYPAPVPPPIPVRAYVSAMNVMLDEKTLLVARRANLLPAPGRSSLQLPTHGELRYQFFPAGASPPCQRNQSSSLTTMPRSLIAFQYAQYMTLRSVSTATEFPKKLPPESGVSSLLNSLSFVWVNSYSLFGLPPV
jgi:hypothetical protein